MQNRSSQQALFLTSISGGAGDATAHIQEIQGTASARLHLVPAFQAAEQLGMQPRVLSLDVDRPQIIDQLGEPRVCVIDKVNHFDHQRVQGFAMATLAAAARLKAQGCSLMVNYCDHLAPLNDSRGGLYRNLLRLADHVITPCDAMATLSKPWLRSGCASTIIEDPWQTRVQSYKTYEPSERLKIVWFGNTGNAHFLCKLLPELRQKANSATAYELVVLGNHETLTLTKQAFDQASESNAARPWTLSLVIWDHKQQPEQLETVLGGAHVALLPSDPGLAMKQGVSHNRLVDASRCGCIPVASPMQSYLELSKIALIGSDLPDILNHLVPQYNRLSAKYSSLRGNLLARFSPETNAQRWRNLLQAFNNIPSNA